MRKSRFSEEQIISILREQEQGRPTPEVCRAHGISANTFYRWKSNDLVPGQPFADTRVAVCVRYPTDFVGKV